MTDSIALIQDLNRSYGWEISDALTTTQLEDLLAETLNEWIRSDFEKLVQFLYRIDVSESKLKSLLEENTEEDTGHLLARLVLERQWQKIQTRRQFKPGETPSDEERW
ncbi:MAG: hypothetical protein JST68_04295 [Bacteroidetes bacterium]|nr:hypothetical protein [Bacteroidota bacterium]